MDNFQLPPTPAFQSLRAVIAAWLLFNCENSSWMQSHECLNCSEAELCFDCYCALKGMFAIKDIQNL